ncbi:MAG: hypothetical protein AAB486_00325 [Patescibacteria group bacterium]
MKPFKYFSHFGYLILTAAFLLTPFLAIHNLLGFSGEKDLPTGAVLSAESTAFNRYLRYLNSQPRTGSRETVSVYVFPGQTTSYRNIYQVKNTKSGPMQLRLTDVRINSLAEPDINAVFYFADKPVTGPVTLSAGERLPVSLQVTASVALKEPSPVEISFTLEME